MKYLLIMLFSVSLFAGTFNYSSVVNRYSYQSAPFQADVLAPNGSVLWPSKDMYLKSVWDSSGSLISSAFFTVSDDDLISSSLTVANAPLNSWFSNDYSSAVSGSVYSSDPAVSGLSSVFTANGVAGDLAVGDSLSDIHQVLLNPAISIDQVLDFYLVKFSLYCSLFIGVCLSLLLVFKAFRYISCLTRNPAKPKA